MLQPHTPKFGTTYLSVLQPYIPETLKNIGFAVNHAFLEKETYCRFKSFKLLTDNQSVIKAVEPYNPVLYIHATKQQSKI